MNISYCSALIIRRRYRIRGGMPMAGQPKQSPKLLDHERTESQEEATHWPSSGTSWYYARRRARHCASVRRGGCYRLLHWTKCAR